MIEKRKQDHLSIVGSNQASFRNKGPLFDQVQLIHHALPETHLDQVDLSVVFLGKQLKAPIMISGMTGGTSQAKQINCDLASIAETLGIGFGLGSQRAMLLQPEQTETYQVRDVAPTTLILANLGLMQAKHLSTQATRALVQSVYADALCLHLNPAMEIIQAEGDRDFRGGTETIKRLQGELGIPIIIKETGCGLSKAVGKTLVELGIRTVDVSGAGGTSWVGVETLRSSIAKTLGDELWDWGIPTAVSVAWMNEIGLEIIATGGVRSGTDVAAALSLGATLVGMAAPVLQAYQSSGKEGALSFLSHVIQTLRAITFLTGAKHVTELAYLPKILGPDLERWITK